MALHLREHIQHRRGSVRVVMDHSPSPTFSSIDIGDPVLEGYWMSAELELTLLHAEFIRDLLLLT